MPRSFHGKTISKTKQEKRLRKLQEEMDARRAATAEGVSSAFSRVSGHQMAGTPYKVLSGKLQPGQSSDPASGFATVDRQVRAASSCAAGGARSAAASHSASQFGSLRTVPGGAAPREGLMTIRLGPAANQRRVQQSRIAR